MSEVVKTYRVAIECSNCHHKQFYDIPKGTEIWEWYETLVEKPVCANCGCSRHKIRKPNYYDNDTKSHL